MCGIVGYWNYLSRRPAERSIITAMTRTLAHRGPDDSSFFVDGDLALGITRLAVVDPQGGRQPMPNEDGTVQAIFNGEIYNHADLRRELESRGHRFRTRSDTEAIVHAFEEWGEDCLDRFNGMFALAVWDSRRDILFLARDRLGIKPLYVYQGREGVVFGSELKAVVTAPWVPLEWDLEAVDDYITYEYVPGRRSIVQGVEKLPPGTSLTVRRGGASPEERTYWRLAAGGPPPTSREAAEAELRDRLQASVSRRLMADVPLGAFLSGGVDSSIIVGLMAQAVPGRVRTFSLGFEDGSYNELPYARLVSERFATQHREEVVAPAVVGLAERLAGLLDEPFADVSAFPTYMVSELARRDVTVALSGDGGDELFAGYDGYRAHRWARRLRRLTRGRPWALVDRLLDGLPPTAAKKGPVNRAKRFAEGLRRPADLEHARWWVFADLVERRALYTEALRRAVAGRDPFGHYRGRLAAGADAGFQGLQRQLYADLTGYLPDDILVKVDRMSMAVSLEARVPFLDHEVVEYAMSVPAAWKLSSDGFSGGASKVLLKAAFRDLLPGEILRRGKEGFSIPMKNWLRGPLKSMMTDVLAPGRLEDRGWFRPEEVARLVKEHLQGRQNHAHRLWCLMALDFALQGLERSVREAQRSTQGIPARRGESIEAGSPD
ncbi:MAG: asparagine synthase (glutamine-hydrolyzing) [Thermoanaerobaculia bacterium]